jgi:hypothetical protein
LPSLQAHVVDYHPPCRPHPSRSLALLQPLHFTTIATFLAELSAVEVNPNDPETMATIRVPRSLVLIVGLTAITCALPTPEPVTAAHPEITPFRVPQIPTRTVNRRNILSDIEDGVNSVLSGLGSDIPSYVASGMLPNQRFTN